MQENSPILPDYWKIDPQELKLVQSQVGSGYTTS